MTLSLQEISDRLEIEALMIRYARSIDLTPNEVYLGIDPFKAAA